MMKAVNIDKNVYAMEMPDGENAEITMYGEIVKERPMDYNTGEPLTGNYIIQSEFLKDLESMTGVKSLTIRLNTVGGDADVGILIHNRLRELVNNGTALKCTVDGVAMSAGVDILCACDTVEVNPSSLVMIHKCWSFLFGAYNADELRDAAKTMDAWDSATAAIYKRKTGLSDTVISHMMSDTTYMTGAEAVEKGFADKLLEDAEPLHIAASADGRKLFVGGKQINLTPGMFAPDFIPTVKSEEISLVDESINPSDTSGGNTKEGDEKMGEVNQTKQAEANVETSDPVQLERQRMRDIDALAALYDADTINAAKYGPDACTAQEMTYRAAQKEAARGKKFLSDLSADNAASGVQNVPAATDTDKPPASSQTPEQRMEMARLEVKSLFEKEKK